MLEESEIATKTENQMDVDDQKTRKRLLGQLDDEDDDLDDDMDIVNDDEKNIIHNPINNLGPDYSERHLFAAGMADGEVLLWDTHRNKAPVMSLKGHEARVNRLAFHPCGHLVASTSNDETWRLWDIETGTELLTQEGHSEREGKLE
jgi:WD40 repeat protein